MSGNVLFGVVKDNVDADKLGRVSVLLNDYGTDTELPWLRVLQPMAGKATGQFWLPEIDDNVVVLQGPGGVDGMLVIGSFYSGKRKPAGEAKVEVKQWLTVGGNEITLDDTEGSEKVTIQTKDSKIAIVMDGSTTEIAIIADSGVNISSTGGPVNVDATEVNLTGSDKIKIDAGSGPVEVKGSKIDVTASGKVTIKGAAVEIG